MDKAIKMKEKLENFDKEIGEINEKNFQTFKERCRIDVVRKGERMDLLGRLHNERREAFQEENILEAQEAGKLLSKQIDQTKKLADGILKLKNKGIWEKKHRQVLRNQNIELKELEAHLKTSYAAKAGLVQLKEREAFEIDEKYFDRKISVVRNIWYKNDAFDKEMGRLEIEKKLKYRNDIHDQLIGNEILRQQRNEEEHRERKIIEEVSEILYKENMEIVKEKNDKISHIKAERDAFFKAKEIWKCKEREAIFDEFNRQAKIIEDRMIDDKNRADKKSDKSIARDIMMEKTARQMLDDEVKRNEKEDIVNELIIEEENNEITKAVQNDIRKKEIIKKELLDDMRRQKLLIAERKARDANEDAEFAKYLAKEYEKALENDKEKYNERFRKGIQYGKELKTVREERRGIYAEEILVRKSIRRYDEEFENQRLDQVALERSKILREHATNLNGFIRAGILRKEDCEYMKNGECNN